MSNNSLTDIVEKIVAKYAQGQERCLVYHHIEKRGTETDHNITIEPIDMTNQAVTKMLDEIERTIREITRVPVKVIPDEEFTEIVFVISKWKQNEIFPELFPLRNNYQE